jgi:hypothetical protein
MSAFELIFAYLALRLSQLSLIVVFYLMQDDVFILFYVNF